jgi:hypothetical protein
MRMQRELDRPVSVWTIGEVAAADKGGPEPRKSFFNARRRGAVCLCVSKCRMGSR